MNSVDLNNLYARTVNGWSDQVRQVGVDQWSRPTPCADWTVRELVNHVTGESLWAVPLVEGSTIEEVGDRFDGDLLGDDPATVALEAADAGLPVVADGLARGGTVHLSYGEEQLDEYVRQLAADHLIHAWDLAAAIGNDLRPDPEVVAGVADWYADREETYRSVGAVGPRTGTHDDRWQDLLAGAGRDPGWRQG
ncbi:MAG TPA: TIGR03086 family metal-binding protein [Marmoricola sp.]|nr:TIGR03086 family metal-binding protein [Marmoricola sp.]